MPTQEEMIYEYIGDDAGKAVDRDPSSTRRLPGLAVKGAQQGEDIPAGGKTTYNQPKGA